MREPLRIRSFRLLFLAQCTSFIGDAIYMIALTFAALEVSARASGISVVLGTGSLALVLTLVVSGVWADRLPRVRVMIASDLVRIVTQTIMAGLLIFDHAELWHLVVLNVVYSAATAFFMPARSGLTPQLLDSHLLISGNSLLATAENLSWMIGWAIGGLLVAAIGVGPAIGLDAATFVASAAMLLLIGHVPLRATARADEDSDEHDETDDKTSSFLRELGEGWHEVVTRRWLWSVILSATLFLLLYEAPMQVVGPLTMEDHYNGAGTWGVVLAALAAGGTLGAIVSSTGRLRRPMLVSLWLFLATVLMPILLIVQAPTAALIACNLVVGFAFGLFDVAWASSLQHRVPEERMARVSAWDWMGSLAGMPLGFALAGGLIDLVGRDVVLVGMSLSTLVVCVALLASREIRSLGDELVPNRSSE